ncbi:MAG: hypothetical protein K2X03_09945 [Bryobacteraceae bacterium]|nr:hypothetical protein [Bryobacteraceae bacterium]
MRRRELLASLMLQGKALPPVRPITRGPKFHWFGYYDKLQFDSTSRHCLGMEVDFEHRSPRAEDTIRVGVIDTERQDKWRELGTTRAWNWQQGCMLQWLPGSRDEVIWNDRREGRFVSVIHHVGTGRERVLDSPIYALANRAPWAITTDFRRLNHTRPGYGYAGVPDPNVNQAAPKDAGIWRVDLATGQSKLLFSVADALDVPQPKGDWSYSPWSVSKHWFNHLLISPDNRRFIFLHRWRGPKEKQGFATRLFTMNADGTQPYVLDPYGQTSHFIWRDAKHIAAFAWHPSLGKQRFYLYEDQTDQVTPIGPDVMTVNGHNTYLAPGKWILNDTYPDATRLQHVYLYNPETNERRALGDFHSPTEYTGEWRCDTHPRSSPDGMKVCIDSPHAGGRQMYLIDLRRYW